jgi:hypothetical protein
VFRIRCLPRSIKFTAVCMEAGRLFVGLCHNRRPSFRQKISDKNDFCVTCTVFTTDNIFL